MEERKIKAWITRGGKHIPIFEDQKIHAPIFKKNLPQHQKKLDKSKRDAEKAWDAYEEHVERLKRAKERIETDNSPEAQKELMNAKRTLAEAQQRRNKRTEKYHSIQNTPVAKSYKFKKVNNKPETREGFEKLPDDEAKKYIKLQHIDYEVWQDKASGWRLEIRKRRPDTQVYSPYYSSYALKDENGKTLRNFNAQKINDEDVGKKAFEESRKVITRFKDPEPYKDILGPKQEIKDPIAKLKECQKENAINPNYKPGQEGKEYYKWHENCAICTCAAVAQAQGWDVEAGPREWGVWRGPTTIFQLANEHSKDHIFGQLVRDKDNVAKGWNKMPSGPDAATKKILKTVKGWGPGTYGELSVRWKHKSSPSGHSMVIINDGDSIYVWDSQDNTIYKNLHSLLSDTVCTKDRLKRLDNATLKRGEDMDEDLRKMFKRRGGK